MAALTVPAWVRGVWRRERLEWEGGEDTTTRVIWVQTPILFADVRTPPAGLPGDDEGFAGHLIVSGRICSWQRPIDVNPARGAADAGAMYRNGTRLVECGLHANYLEDWRQEADGERHLAATRGKVSIDGGDIVWPAEGPLELLVACGGHVIHAFRHGRSAALRYGRFDPATGILSPAWRVGPGSAGADLGMPWTLWSSTMTPVARDALLGELGAL